MIHQKFRWQWLAIVLLVFISILVYNSLIRPNILPTQSLTISAAISVSAALEEIQDLYQSNSNNLITYNFASSGKLRQQIEQGAPVDIYLSAGSNHMDILQQKKLIIPATRQNLLKNRLVLIASKNNTRQAIANFQDLLKPEIKRVAIGDPRTVPAGAYAAELLMNLSIYDQLQSKLIFGNNVRQVLTFVETGNVDAGIVYITDALSAKNVTPIEVASENLHSPIIYPVAVVQGSKNFRSAEDYIHFLFSHTAKAVFAKHGFNLAN